MRCFLSMALALTCLSAFAIDDKEKVDGFKPIFDGKTLEGWEGNQKTFRVEDGAILAGTLKEKIPNNEFLCSKQEYGNFELRLQARLRGDGKNAGIQFRSARIPNHFEVKGYQCDMGLMADRSIWGSLYDESRRNKFLAQGEADAVGTAVKEGEWNDIVIRCEGKKVQLWVNGVQTVNYEEKDADIAEKGVIGLQIHGLHGREPGFDAHGLTTREPLVMKWRAIRIRPLDGARARAPDGR